MKIFLILLTLAMCATGATQSVLLLETERWKHNRWIKLALGFYLACLFLAFR